MERLMNYIKDKRFVGKRILLMCKETYSYPLFFLAQIWKEDNELAAFFFNPVESRYGKCLLNDTTYYAFKKLDFIKVYDCNDIADKFTEIKDAANFDLEFLENIEENYTHFRSINLQIMSSQYLTRQYHFRNYMTECSYEQQMLWLELNYKRVVEVLDEFQPDVVLDCDNAELARCILNEVCNKRKIPYIVMEYPRYEMYKTYSYRMGIGIDRYFIDEYNKSHAKSDEDLKSEIAYVHEYRNKSEIMSREYQNTVTAQYEPDSWLVILKKLWGKLYYFYFDQDFKGKNRKLKKRNKIIYNNSYEYVKFYFRVELLRKKLMKKNSFFESPVDGEKYVYMPLHLIPESTTFVKAPFFVNELHVIEAVSKALPVGWRLYVKEHQAMLGERGVEFYNAVKRIPNVRLVQLNYYNDPKPWILKSQGVITITGTSAYEAAMLGKKALVFGEVIFNLIEGITKVNSFEELPQLIQGFGGVDNIHSCAAYLNAVSRVGKEINIRYIMAECEKILRNQTSISEKLVKELANMNDLFYDAYCRYVTNGEQMEEL